VIKQSSVIALLALALIGCGSTGSSSGGGASGERAVFAPYLDPDSDEVCEDGLDRVLCLYHERLYSISLTDCRAVYPEDFLARNPARRGDYVECQQITEFARGAITDIRQREDLFEAMGVMEFIDTFRGATSRDDLLVAGAQYLRDQAGGPSGSRVDLETRTQCAQYQRISDEIDIEEAMASRPFRRALADAAREADLSAGLICR